MVIKTSSIANFDLCSEYIICQTKWELIHLIKITFPNDISHMFININNYPGHVSYGLDVHLCLVLDVCAFRAGFCLVCELSFLFRPWFCEAAVVFTAVCFVRCLFMLFRCVF